MFDAAVLMGLYAETSLHPGSGKEQGAVDLPVQREAHTNVPMIPGSSLKGVLRSVGELMVRRPQPTLLASDVSELFGPNVGSGNDHGGALSVGDARLILFPVRSIAGMFTWITCPLMIGRLVRDATLCGLTTPQIPLVTPQHVVIGVGSALTANSLVFEDEDYDMMSPNPQDLSLLEALLLSLLPSTAGYERLRERVRTRLAILSDEDFVRLTEKSTSKTTRIRLNAQKTTTGGGGNMWMEETIPSDALFYSAILAMPSRRPGSLLDTGALILDKLRTGVIPTVIQVGGNETVGQGWMRTTFAESA